MIYWVSWCQKDGEERPTKYPPLPEVLGYWISGYDPDNSPVICALINASSNRYAQETIEQYWSVRNPEWRFCMRAAFNLKRWQKTGRFPLPEWSPLLKGEANP